MYGIVNIKCNCNIQLLTVHKSSNKIFSFLFQLKWLCARFLYLCIVCGFLFNSINQLAFVLGLFAKIAVFFFVHDSDQNRWQRENYGVDTRKIETRATSHNSNKQLYKGLTNLKRVASEEQEHPKVQLYVQRHCYCCCCCWRRVS